MGVVLSWRLPDIANQSDVRFDSYSISYTRAGSGMSMTDTSNTSTIAISGLVSDQNYEFSVSASYSRPLLQSGEDTLTEATRRKLGVLTLRVLCVS